MRTYSSRRQHIPHTHSLTDMNTPKHTHTHTHTHTRTHYAHTLECVYVSVSDRVHAYLRVCVRAHMLMRVWVCARVRKCECTSVCLCVGL